MNKKQYIISKVKLVKAENKITVIASDETLDRHGDVLPIDQWDLTKFLGSPRMLVDHNHQVEKIVGKWENIRIQGKELLMEANFHEITPLSKAVKEMVDGEYLDTVSVGFISHGPKKDGDRGSMELIETSWVTVPANPNARVIKSAFDTALEKEVTTEAKTQVKDFLGKDLIDDEADLEAGDDDLEIDEGEDEEIEEVDEEKPDELNLATVISTVDAFKKLPAETVKVECSYDFVLQLINDSEKHMTLTNGKSGLADPEKVAKVMEMAFKHAAHVVNDTLRKLNKRV